MQERSDDVAPEAGDPSVAELDVRDDERPPGRLDERAAGGGDLRLRLAWSDLERNVERPVLRYQADQVIEHGHSRGNAGLAVPRDVDARVQPSCLVGLTRPSHGRPGYLERRY